MKATDHGRRAHHLLRRLCALVCLAGLGLSAHAATSIPLSEQLTGWSPRAGGGWERNAYNERNAAAIAANRSWAGAGAGASARVIATDVAVIAGRAGSLPVASSMAVGIGDAAAAVARCIAGGGPVCAAASVAAALYTTYRVYQDYDGEGLLADPGVSQVTGTVTKYFGSASNGAYSGSASLKNTIPAACQWRADWLKGVNPANNYTVITCPATVGAQYTVACATSGGGNCGNYTGTIVATGVTETACPASIDALNPAYSIPYGAPPGADGKCEVGRYNRVPISADAAAAKVVASPPADPTPWVQPTKDAIQSGGQSAPAGITTTGPASQTGTPTSTTTTGGSPAQTVNETKTPTYTYNYAGDTITYNTSYTTVTNNITNGTTTTTTETPAPATPQDPEDPCTAEPDRLGCIKLGKPPDDQVPTKSSEISYSAESVGLPSGCPSPKTIAGKSFSYEPICETATNARPWVIVGAVFSALMLMLAGVRQV